MRAVATPLPEACTPLPVSHPEEADSPQVGVTTLPLLHSTAETAGPSALKQQPRPCHPGTPDVHPVLAAFIWAESVVSPPLLRFCVTAHSLTAVPTTGSLSFRVKAPQEPLKPWLSSLSLGPPRSALLQLQSVEFRLSFMAPACCPPKSPSSSSFSIWDNGIKAEEASVAPVCPACPGLWREPGRCISSSLFPQAPAGTSACRLRLRPKSSPSVWDQIPGLNMIPQVQHTQYGLTQPSELLLHTINIMFCPSI